MAGRDHLAEWAGARLTEAFGSVVEITAHLIGGDSQVRGDASKRAAGSTEQNLRAAGMPDPMARPCVAALRTAVVSTYFKSSSLCFDKRNYHKLKFSFSPRLVTVIIEIAGRSCGV